MDDDDITSVWSSTQGGKVIVGNASVVSDEGKEWMAHEALRGRWLEGRLQEEMCGSIRFL